MVRVGRVDCPPGFRSGFSAGFAAGAPACRARYNLAKSSRSSPFLSVCLRYAPPHSGRLIALPHLPIDHADVSAELAKKYAAQSEVGFSIGPGGVSQPVLSEPAYEPLWQALDDNACFVMIHPGACCDGRLNAFYLENLLGNPHETSVAVAHLVFANVPARYPNIKFCLSHGGGNVPILAGRWQRGYDSDRPGINKNIDAPLQMLKRFYADSIVHNPDALALSESVFGEDHILFGSDWPFPMGLIDVEDQLSGTKPEILERMFTINPKQLLASMKISA
ncbi:MAG TPA: amidohydrolase [Candidatus Handelsmanbacteria bacterium]|nr:amidohydrolase [Candidatus Handelsmanbacteria bacterium]